MKIYGIHRTPRKKNTAKYCEILWRISTFFIIKKNEKYYITIFFITNFER